MAKDNWDIKLTTKKKAIWIFSIAVIVAVALLLVGTMGVLSVAAGMDSILWDNGLPDNRQALSCVDRPDSIFDNEIVDDFDVPEPGWNVTDGHFRIVTHSSGHENIIGVNVYFYKDNDSQPATDQYAERVATYNVALTGKNYFGRPEIAVDCTFDTVTLAPGKWWVCFQPEVDENTFWLTAAGSGESVFFSFPAKWVNSSTAFGEDYDVSFQLTGHPASAPVPALTPTGLIALVSALSAIAIVTLIRKRR